MLKKFLKIIMYFYSVGFMFGGIAAFFGCMNGGNINMDGQHYDGGSGVLISIVSFIVGANGLYRLITKDKKKEDTSSNIQEYPFCRWWRQDEVWYHEHNPLIKHEEYPQDGKCHVCKKNIEDITDKW